MDNQTNKDQTNKDRKGSDQRDSNIGQQPAKPAGTSGRTDADLQKEGNLGNERSRSDRDEDQEEPGMGTRPGQNK